MSIEGPHQDNVFLLPATIDYYQEQLTRMLETERFNEAVALLEFLLKCRSDDPITEAEWRRLLDWLKTTFSSATETDPDGDEEEEVTESDLHKQRFYTKMAEDPGYVKKLLEIVLTDPDLEKKMLAIEQLTVADHPQIDETLKRWIQQVDLHPLIQYKVLQSLRARGVSGQIELSRGGETIQLMIEETPLDLIHYPDIIQLVLERVKAVSEVEQPSLVYFAEHTWREFLAYCYGTSLYEELCQIDTVEAEAWAAALHAAVVESMTGAKPEALSMLYRLPPALEARVKHHQERLFHFIHHTFST